MKTRFLLLSAIALLLSLSTAKAQDAGKISLTAEERELVKSNNDFAFNLFRAARDREESQFVSPLSVTYALAMMENAASGVTREEIHRVLGFGDMEMDAVNAFCHKLITESALLDEDTKVMISNMVYLNSNRGFSLMPGFKENVSTYYGVMPEVRDFYDGKTLNVINQWASDHTEGMVNEVMNESTFNPKAISYLLNALYFKGSWKLPFYKPYTMTGFFDDGKATADMMSLENGYDIFSYAENDICQAVVLPYGNTSYQMTVFLPRRGKTIDDVLGMMDGERWRNQQWGVNIVDIRMPRFETTTQMELEDIMAGLGVSNAFEGEGFDGFCYEGDDVTQYHRTWIGKMKQVAKIKLDEEGTEAAAVTIIEATDGDPGEIEYKVFNADRPFLYVISERSTGVIFFVGQYLGERIDNPRNDISLTEEEQELVRKNNDFAIRLLREAHEEGSQVLSPLSITYALGMINNGAAGKTQQEINDVLGFGDAGADAINAFCRKMLNGCGNVDKHTKVMIANNIYVNKDYQLQAPFIQKAYDYYNATPETRDFHDGKTMDVINQWASDHTEGVIKEVINENQFDPSAVSYLLNAIYFKGGWTLEFDVDDTREEPFNNGENVMMMSQRHEFAYRENDIFQAVHLPYGNGAYQMSVFLPRKGKTIDDVLNSLEGDDKMFLGGYADVNLKLPRMDVETHIKLNDVMSALGMPTAFDKFLADFPYFCDASIYIAKMNQVAKMKVDEKGTEAAAVTIIETRETGMQRPVTFYADHPFLFTISELSTGVILFIGQYTGTGNATTPNSIVEHPLQKDNGDALIYNLQGQRLQAPPTHGIYIMGGKKTMMKR